MVFHINTKLIKFTYNLKENALAEIVQAVTEEQIAEIRILFLEYAEWLEFDLCFQGFDKELEGLPGKYTAPKGRLYLLMDGDNYAGCIALRQIDKRICEMKRLYIRPGFRGRDYGKLLAEKIIDDAKTIGYDKMRLDTIGERMKKAFELYKSLGFGEIEAYYDNPQPGVVYMELDLKNTA